MEEILFFFVLLVFLIIGFIAAFSPEKIRDLNIKMYQRMPDVYKKILIKFSNYPVVLFALRLSGIIILAAAAFMIYSLKFHRR